MQRLMHVRDGRGEPRALHERKPETPEQDFDTNTAIKVVDLLNQTTGSLMKNIKIVSAISSFQSPNATLNKDPYVLEIFKNARAVLETAFGIKTRTLVIRDRAELIGDKKFDDNSYHLLFGIDIDKKTGIYDMYFEFFAPGKTDFHFTDQHNKIKGEQLVAFYKKYIKGRIIKMHNGLTYEIKKKKLKDGKDAEYQAFKENLAKALKMVK